MLKELRAKLEGEVADLTHELRVKLPDEIGRALELGDLRENAEYKAALERQELVKLRLGQLQKRLGELSALDVRNLPRDRAAFGSTVTVVNLDTEDEIVYRLVTSELADLDRGWISVSSPIGRGFVGKQAGDEVRVQTPGGVKRFEVQDVVTLHDQED
jgi:transcription elongation factor GreA